MLVLAEVTPVTVPVQVVNAVELNALDPNSLVPTTLEPFIITAVASEFCADRPVKIGSLTVTLSSSMEIIVSAYTLKFIEVTESFPVVSPILRVDAVVFSIISVLLLVNVWSIPNLFPEYVKLLSVVKDVVPL